MPFNKNNEEDQDALDREDRESFEELEENEYENLVDEYSDGNETDDWPKGKDSETEEDGLDELGGGESEEN